MIKLSKILKEIEIRPKVKLVSGRIYDFYMPHIQEWMLNLEYIGESTISKNGIVQFTTYKFIKLNKTQTFTISEDDIKEMIYKNEIRYHKEDIQEIELDTNLTPEKLMKFLDKNRGEVFYELGIIGNKRGNPETFYDLNDLYFEVEENMVYLSGFPAGRNDRDVTDGVIFSTMFNENFENDFTIKNIKIYYTIF